MPFGTAYQVKPRKTTEGVPLTGEMPPIVRAYSNSDMLNKSPSRGTVYKLRGGMPKYQLAGRRAQDDSKVRPQMLTPEGRDGVPKLVTSRQDPHCFLILTGRKPVWVPTCSRPQHIREAGEHNNRVITGQDLNKVSVLKQM